jgi:acetoin utilization deacetylase AcuC-like enzyme
MPILLTLVPSSVHSFEGHPENTARFSHFQRLESLSFYPQIQWQEAVPASFDDVTRVHSPAMITQLQELSQKGLLAIDASPTYLTSGSWQSAMTAAGGALGITRAILRHSLDQNAHPPQSNLYGQDHKGFALIRPPGHHAGTHQTGGFCLLNKGVTLAAEQ